MTPLVFEEISVSEFFLNRPVNMVRLNLLEIGILRFENNYLNLALFL